MKNVLKSILCSLITVGMAFQCCVPVFAQEQEPVVEETVKEQETVVEEEIEISNEEQDVVEEEEIEVEQESKATTAPLNYVTGIHFCKNGATGGTMSDLTGIKVNQSYTLPANAFTKKGYKFVAWNTQADGSGTKYTNKQVVKNIKSTSKTLNLYARWTPQKYTINYYNLLGGTNSASNPTSYTINTSTITLSAPKRTGYTFVGWYTSTSWTTKVTQIAKGSTGNKTLYARWTPVTYTISYYNLSGGTNNTANPTSYRISTPTITLKAPTKSGYSFVGWYTSTNWTTKVTQIPKGSTGNKTLYARWQKNTTNIDKSKVVGEWGGYDRGSGLMQDINIYSDGTFKINGNHKTNSYEGTYSISGTTVTLNLKKEECYAGTYAGTHYISGTIKFSYSSSALTKISDSYGALYFSSYSKYSDTPYYY